MSYDNIAQQMRDEAQYILDRGIITRGQRLVVAGLLRDAADEFDRLTDRHNQALASLDGVEHLWHEAGCPGPLGFSKIANVAGVLERLQIENRELRRENRAWMNGVADVVEPLGYDRQAASGPADLLPGLKDITDRVLDVTQEQARRLSECVEARSYLYEQVVALSGQLDAQRTNEAKPIAGPLNPFNARDALDSELAAIGSECDWGDCSDESIALRWSPEVAAYLPVCTWHRGLPNLNDPAILDELRRFYETNGRGMQ
jgi:hypothetical protein